ncbi:MAG: Tad domain-containing protein [Pseudobdellovibrionaceae bacterium]
MQLRKPSLSSQRGQLSLFVALTFQVLFVFFAMVINVGLLVHHKINLQNSVDLAAYYGAAKQSESLNAIAHINYQIRQAYKLLMFRYHHIGGAGENIKHPYDYRSGAINNDTDEKLDYRTIFCVGYPPFGFVNNNESYCHKTSNETNRLTLPGDPRLNVVASFFFLDLAFTLSAASAAAVQAAREGCERISQLNWLMLSTYLASYKMDVRNRKQVLIKLAQELSKDAPLDVDGGFINQGAFKTFYKNLSSANAGSILTRYREDGSTVAQGAGASAAGVKFSTINGFAQGGCGNQGAEWEPPKWLSEVSIFPYMRYLDAQCGGATTVDFLPKYINAGGANSLPNNRTAISQDIINLVSSINDEPQGDDASQRLLKSSLGFEKNPWCMGYYGVQVEATPKIPFSPLGDVTLTAKAYAKPFGGRIGPWYGTTWERGQFKSSDNPKTDRLSPMRIMPGSLPQITAINDPAMDSTLDLNHSRYMGDEVGVRSKLHAAQAARGLFTLHKRNLNPINVEWWGSVFKQNEQFGAVNTNSDPLAWDETANTAPKIRQLEIAAIAPDQFDATFYSIDADFHNNYQTRLKQAYENRWGGQFQVRGDLGQRPLASEEKLKKYSVRHQVDDTRANTELTNAFDVNGKLTYYLSDFAQLLTGWLANEQMADAGWKLEENRFGVCGEKVADTEQDSNKFTSGACKWGGRVGYSVKLVSDQYLNSSNLKLGGESRTGSILNQPPRSF